MCSSQYNMFKIIWLEINEMFNFYTFSSMVNTQIC